MELTNYRLPLVEKTKITNERQHLLEKFLAVKVNGIMVSNRKGGYRPIEAKELAVKLSHIKTNDLEAFYKQCEQAKHFGKYFSWAIKV